MGAPLDVPLTRGDVALRDLGAEKIEDDNSCAENNDT
jgi:hypothetical protein